MMRLGVRGVSRRLGRRLCSTDEDENGRPLGVPAGLGAADLVKGSEYWMERTRDWERHSTLDWCGRRQVPTRKPGEPLFSTAIDVKPEDEPLTLRNVARRVPISGVCMDRIEVPVFNMRKEQVGTRDLDPYVFGMVPHTNILFQATRYETQRRLGYGGRQQFGRAEVPGPHDKFMANHTGSIVRKWKRNLTDEEEWSGATTKARLRRWQDRRLDMPAYKQSQFIRQSLTLKLMKERLIILDDLQFPVPSVEIFRDWAHSWGFDRDRLMAYIIDGGTQWAPSQEMHKNSFWTNIFVYGLQVQQPRSYNSFDALRHHYLVLTEGAVQQFERFFDIEKASVLPPHVTQQMTHELADLDETEFDWTTVQEEGAWEVAKEEESMLDGYRDLHDPWLNGKRWDANEERIRAHRMCVSDNLPRKGDAVNDDMRNYWKSRSVNVAPPSELPETDEYVLKP